VSVPSPQRPRVLLADADAARRRRLRQRLGEERGTAEAGGPEDALVWLEGQAPGLTVLVAGADLAADCQAVARVRELFPEELVVLAAPSPTPDLSRRAMRAGAFDLLPLEAALEGDWKPTLEEAFHRLASSRTERRLAEDKSRDAVRRHEREAAAHVAETNPSTGAWADLEVGVRRRWLHGYLKALALSNPAERAAFVRELAEQVSALPRPAEVLLSLHLHAVASASGAQEPGIDHARTLLLDVFAQTAGLLRASPSAASAGRKPSAAPASAAWHRWRRHGAEDWWLVVDGRLRAHVRVGSSSVEGTWMRDPTDGILVGGLLPALPEALREVERRVGSGYVLEVSSAAVP
jgi:hypothetical protein